MNGTDISLTLPTGLAEATSDPARLSLLGHDLRAAVSDIIGGLRLIDHETLDDGTRLQLERVRASGEVLARLLEEGLSVMLGETEPAEAQAANLQLARFLYDIEVRWSGRAREKGIGFHLARGEDLPQVIMIDRIALERIMANILSNAVKYTDTGAVRMAVSRLPDGTLRVTVEDDGPGFSEAALSRLFKAGGRPDGAHKPGQGLGMHITKDMTGRLGGTVQVTNRAGGGASVVVDLPPQSWAVGLPEPDTALPDLSKVKVLLAEDSATNQTIMGHMLTRMGAEYQVASDGVEAMHWLEREEFDIALIDIEMPRLSGIDVIRAMRSSGGTLARLPVLAVTAYVLRANREAIYAAGADGILAKPIAGVETFGQAIAGLLGRLQGMTPSPESPAASETAEIDAARFEHLLDIAGPLSARELLERLNADLRNAERGLVTALGETDRAGIMSETHVLIALAGAVGAGRLQAQASQLNAAAHRRDDGTMRPLGHDALAALDRLITFVSHELAKRSDHK